MRALPAISILIATTSCGERKPAPREPAGRADLVANPALHRTERELDVRTRGTDDFPTQTRLADLVLFGGDREYVEGEPIDLIVDIACAPDRATVTLLTHPDEKPVGAPLILRPGCEARDAREYDLLRWYPRGVLGDRERDLVDETLLHADDSFATRIADALGLAAAEREAFALARRGEYARAAALGDPAIRALSAALNTTRAEWDAGKLDRIAIVAPILADVAGARAAPALAAALADLRPISGDRARRRQVAPAVEALTAALAEVGDERTLVELAELRDSPVASSVAAAEEAIWARLAARARPRGDGIRIALHTEIRSWFPRRLKIEDQLAAAFAAARIEIAPADASSVDAIVRAVYTEDWGPRFGGYGIYRGTTIRLTITAWSLQARRVVPLVDVTGTSHATSVPVHADRREIEATFHEHAVDDFLAELAATRIELTLP